MRLRRPELVWLGVGGVPPADAPDAYIREQRLHWLMIGVALLAIPFLFLDEFAHARPARPIGPFIEVLVLAAFAVEIAWMLRVTQQRLQYLLRSWLNLVVIVLSLAVVVGFGSERLALVSVIRFALIGLLLLRTTAACHRLFRKATLPYVLAFAGAVVLLGGVGFHWVEPSVHGYGQGVRLAFLLGTTVGLGEVVPTTRASYELAVLVVVLGVATMSMLVAGLGAMLLPEDDGRMHDAVHEDILSIGSEIAQLVDEEQRGAIRDLHLDVWQLREEIAQLQQDVGKARAALE